MANNIMNIMSVSFNSQAELEDFLNRVKGKDDDGEKDFSLQSVVPMPESLQIVSPCDRMLAWAAVNKYGIDPEKYPENVRKAICRETFLLHRKEKLTASDMVGVCKEAAEARSKLEHVKDSKLINLKRIPYNVEEFDTVAERALENAVKYGYASWYYWRVSNWGVKWDVFDVNIRRINDTEIAINFKTPWNTPACAIVELSRKFPHANIRVKYADEDIGSNCGWYALCKGDFVDDGYPSKGNAAIDFACNIWGYDANAYRAEMSLL